MFDLSVKLLCTSKPGTLSRLIRRLKEFGFQYLHHSIEIVEEYSEISLDCRSELPCLEKDLRHKIISLPEVIKIIEFSFNGNQLKNQPPKAKVTTLKSSNKLKTSFEVSPMVIKLTERRLTRLIGPVAPFLVKKAAETSKNVGELYIQLSKELDEDDLADFLSVIDLEG